MRIRGANGQTTAEYAILIGVAIAALLGMQVYTRRGLNARWKDASDSASRVVADQLLHTSALDTDYEQYEPYYASSDYTVKQDAGADVHERDGGIMTRDNIEEVTSRTGTQDVAVPQ